MGEKHLGRSSMRRGTLHHYARAPSTCSYSVLNLFLSLNILHCNSLYLSREMAQSWHPGNLAHLHLGQVGKTWPWPDQSHGEIIPPGVMGDEPEEEPPRGSSLHLVGDCHRVFISSVSLEHRTFHLSSRAAPLRAHLQASVQVSQTACL